MSIAAVKACDEVARDAGRRRPLRVGIYTPTYPGISEGGIGTYTRHLAHGLTALGYVAHVLTAGPEDGACSDGAVSVHTTIRSYIPVVDRVVPGAGANWHVGRAMRRLVARHELDIVEFPNWEGLGLYFSFQRHVPVVVRLHTSSLDSQAIDGGAIDRRQRWDVRREIWQAKMADALVTHSHIHRAAISKQTAISEDRICVVPHGINVYPDFERPDLARDHLSVVYLGRMERRKGTVDLLRAIPEILRCMPNVGFTLIGPDRPHCPGERTHAQFAADELPQEARERVQFLGELPSAEVDRWLQSADLFVAPSLYESFGLIFLEAMRWGTPVVGTRAGGIPEIIEDGVTGSLVAPGNPQELAAKMVQLLRDGPRRRKLGEAGRRHVETQFSVDRMALRVAELYEGTLGKYRGRRER